MLTALRLQDFTVFAKADLSFGSINVIHGENASGKTHLLKLAYSIVSSLVVAANEAVAERPTKAFMDSRFGFKLVGVFRPDRGKHGRLARRIQGYKRSEILADFGSAGQASFSFSTQSDKAVKADELSLRPASAAAQPGRSAAPAVAGGAAGGGLEGAGEGFASSACALRG